MGALSTSQLDEFVDFVDRDCHGDLQHPKLAEKYLPLSLQFQTPIDETGDPFGDAYYDSQIALYREIAGRALDQGSGELHPVDIDTLVGAANPLGINNVGFIADHVRALSTMLSLACLADDARILDMGAGHGVSSEVFAFCGARVRAVDIDPGLSTLAARRASARSLRIERVVMNFDSLDSIEDDAYKAAFFFQSLHHCLRPWELIAALKRKVAGDGVIAFAGEPVQDSWWRHWGIRLDAESLYVARKHGWFESGWSRAFIQACFKRCGLDLVLFDTGLQGGVLGIACKDGKKAAAILERASSMGLTPTFATDIENAPRNFFSKIGDITKGPLGATIRARADHEGGHLCYGPYISLAPGKYRISFVLRLPEAGRGRRMAVFDVICADRPQPLIKHEIRLAEGETTRFVSVLLEQDHEMRRLEARVKIPSPRESWEMSLPYFERQST